MSKRDLLNFDGLTRREFDGILDLAEQLKRKQKRGIAHRLLAGRGLGYIDVHLLAAARLSNAGLWTTDKRLQACAELLSLSARP